MGPDIMVIGHPWGGSATRVGSVAVPSNRIIALVAAAVLIGLFFLLQISYGWARADVMRQMLEKACAAKDLTREGLAAARKGLTSVDTGGLAPTLNDSTTGVPPTTQSYLMKAADAPGGLVLEKGPYKGPDAA